MTDIARDVTRIADAWLNRLLKRLSEVPPAPHRQTCELCPTSPLLPALGSFGALPHYFVHPLVRGLTELIDDDDVARLEAAQRRLREEWRDGPKWQGAAEPWRDELNETLDLHTAAVAEVVAALREFTTDHAEVADRAIHVMTSAVERHVANTGWLIDPRSRRALVDTIREAIEDWCVWLSSGEWEDAHAVLAGSRCTGCAALGLDDLGVHGAAHELTAAIQRVELTFLEGFAVPRIEPPGDGALQLVRVELRFFVVAALSAARVVIGNAMVAYVTPHVDRRVHEASRWIDTGDDGSLG